MLGLDQTRSSSTTAAKARPELGPVEIQRIAMRSDKTDASYAATINLTAAVIRLR
jgi:hypothetical protein